MARLARTFAVGASLLLLSLLASSCGSSGAVDAAKQACRQVDKSIALYQTITPSTPQATASAITLKAQSELLTALSSAAAATSSDGSFNALMTTIGEGSRVPESLLIPALKAQCKVVMSSSPFLVS